MKVRYHIKDSEGVLESPLVSSNDEVAVVLNEKAKRAIIKRGVPEKNIIVVEELVINELKRLADQNKYIAS